MDITRVNFELTKREFSSLLQTCEFYAMDQEMTGISVSGVKETPIMNVGEKYSAQRSAAMKYNAFQIGICLFHRDGGMAPGTVSFTARPFNFYLLGNPWDADVQLNLSAVQFLSKNGMDWQTWLTQGIPYCTAATENRVAEDAYPKPTGTLNASEEQFIAESFEKIKSFVAADSVSPQEPLVISARCSATTHTALYFKLLEEEVSVIATPALTDNLPPWRRKETVFRRASAEELEAYEAAQNATRAKKVEDRIGFRWAFKELVKSRKPMIGHNFFSDLLFMLNQHEACLPASYEEYRTLVANTFPTLFDTKTLAKRLLKDASQSTALGPLYAHIVAQGNAPVVRLPVGFESYDPMAVRKATEATGSSPAAHQAAYDAYMTGVVYAAFLTQNPSEVEGMRNLISIFSCAYFMGVAPIEDTLESPTFVLTFPMTLNRDDLAQCNAMVKFLSDTTALVSMVDGKATQDDYVAAVSALDKGAVTTCTLEEYKATASQSAATSKKKARDDAKEGAPAAKEAKTEGP